VQEPLVKFHTPSSLITLVQKFTRFDKSRRWKGPRVKEADYFKSLNSSATGWYDVYARRYAPFRYCRASSTESDASSMIEPYNDPRVPHGHQSANMDDLIEALRSNGILVRKDDSLAPGKDFMPRTYPDDSTKA